MKIILLKQDGCSIGIVAALVVVDTHGGKKGEFRVSGLDLGVKNCFEVVVVVLRSSSRR